MEKMNIFKPLYSLTHAPIGGHFSKNSNNFVVREEPLYDFSGSGEHSVIGIEKKGLTTFEALHILSEHLGVKMRDFGYAGLKDKEGLTSQYISFPYKFEPNLSNFSHDKLKIISVSRHENKIRIGHLKGNNFFIRLKKVLPIDAAKLKSAFETLEKQGFANYFGYQRFGKFGDNAEQGAALLRGEKKIKNPKIKNFLISSYQSDLFNRWLSKRVEISRFSNEFSKDEFSKIYSLSSEETREIISQPQFYKLLKGEVLGHYPYGKFFICEDLKSEIQRFCAKEITSCGLLVGEKAYKSIGIASKFEDEIFASSYDLNMKITGSRRFAWCYVENSSCKYDEENANFSMNFFLPKGSYATVFLEEILHRNIFDEIMC